MDVILARQLRLVAAGGVVGASLRWLVLALAADESQDLVTLVLNVVGAALLGGLVALRAAKPRPALSNDTFALLGTGFCGALTTFSAFALSVARLLDTGQTWSAVGAGLQTVLGAVIASGVGYRIGTIITRQRRARSTNRQKATRKNPTRKGSGKKKPPKTSRTKKRTGETETTRKAASATRATPPTTADGEAPAKRAAAKKRQPARRTTTADRKKKAAQAKKTTARKQAKGKTR